MSGRIKIVALLIILGLVIAGGLMMFNSFNKSRTALNSNIYDFIPNDAMQLMFVSTPQGLNNASLFNPELASFGGPLQKWLAYPFYVAEYPYGQLIIAKINPKHEDTIKDILLEVSGAPYAKEIDTDGAKIYFFALPQGKFLTCAFYEGIMGISTDYKLVEKMLDPARTPYFDLNTAQELISKIKGSRPIFTFINDSVQSSVTATTVYPDSIVIEGYISPTVKGGNITIPQYIAPINTTQSDSIVIDTIRRRNDVLLRMTLITLTEPEQDNDSIITDNNFIFE